MIQPNVINDIMSAKAPILIMPASSDGKSVGFLSELVNFYRYTYWLSCEYDPMTSFPIVFAEKVFGKGEEYRRILQFKHCEFEYDKDKVIIGHVLEKIASDNADSLLIIDGLELLNDKVFDGQLEYLLKKCPKNLKIVLVSKRFVDLNYNNSDVCPRLIEPVESTDENFDFSTLEKDQNDFLYAISALKCVEIGFCETIYPEARILLDFLSRQATSYVMKKGSILYCFSPELRDRLRPTATDDEALTRKQIEYFLQTDQMISALDLAMKNDCRNLLTETVKRLIETGEKVYDVVGYFRVHSEREFEASEEDDIALKYITAVVRATKRDGKRLMNVADDIISHTKRDTPLERLGHYAKFLAFYFGGQYRAALDYARDIVHERVKVSADIRNWARILCRLPDVIKRCDTEVIESDFLFYEDWLEGEDYSREYWYAKALQAVAEVYFLWGNYNKAIELIDRIKQRIPFYIIPYRLLDFYFYIGDMRLAYETARQALRASKFHDIEADLTEVYLLLAKSSDYLNRKDEAIKYIDYAVNLSGNNPSKKYFAIAYKALICAKSDKPTYGKDLAAVYEKSFSYRSNKSEYMIYCALAYCSYKLEEYEDAERYALKCELKSPTKSGAWLVSRAIELDVRLRENGVEVNEVEKLFEQCKNSGMTVIVVSYFDCFSPLFDFAKRSGLRLPATVEMQRKVKQKLNSGEQKKDVVVRLFGDTYVGVNGREIRWKTKKEKELFLLYVWKGKAGLDRGYLLDSLWSDYVYESGVNNLKTTNCMLRKTFSDAGVPYTMKYANGRYYFRVECTTDLELFLRLCDEYNDSEKVYERLEIGKKLFALYNGGFCREIPTDVFVRYREELLAMTFQIFYRLAVDMAEQNEMSVALRIAKQLESQNFGEEYVDRVEELKNYLRDKKV